MAAHKGLDEFILRHIGRAPASSMEIWRRVVDDYGKITARTLYRYLNQLAAAQRIRQVSCESDYPNQRFYVRVWTGDGQP